MAMSETMSRQKPMKALVLGLPRTGTTSTYHALRKLGLKPYHFAEVAVNKDKGHWQLWLKAVQAKYDGLGKPFEGTDFDQMLWDYDAVLDTPCCVFVEELVAAYPEAKVILTIRTAESWLKSMQTTILEVISWRSWTVLSYFDQSQSAPFWALVNRLNLIWSRGLPPYKPESRPTLLQSFEEHNALVRRVVPAERLLEFHPSQGWEPLCEFLDIPIPEGEFPHLNDTDYFAKHYKSLYWKRWAHVGGSKIGFIGVAGAIMAAAVWSYAG